MFIPPIYNDVLTARLAPGGWTPARLKSAQTRLEAALNYVQKPYPQTGAGLTMVVSWACPTSAPTSPGRGRPRRRATSACRC